MNENVNLCEILKGHEGEIFYSPLYGNIKLFNISTVYAYPLWFSTLNKNGEIKTFDKYGYPDKNVVECLLFPSKYQRDWNKWNAENNHKTPKTWIELKNSNKEVTYNLSTIDSYGVDKEIEASPIEKSVLALLKIHQLIEVGYGGNVTNDDWNYDVYKCVIGCYSDTKEFKIVETYHYKSPIAFHTKLQAEEFISYPENVQLLKDYYMI